MYYFYKTPAIIKKLFSKYIWDMPKDKNAIYLTFDDGPTLGVTTWTLDLLNTYNAKATFFCEGQNVKKFPEIVLRAYKENHSIGNHSYTHVNGWKTKTSKYIKEVQEAEKVILETLNVKKKDTNLLLRPPYGKIKTPQARALKKKGYKIIMFDVVSGDFDPNISPERSLQQVLKHTKPGSIIVFHDSINAQKVLKFVLPKAMEYWSKKGYQFLAL